MVDHLLLRDFGPYGIIFINMCFLTTVAMVILFMDFGPNGIVSMNVCVITIAMVMLLSDFEPYGIIFMSMCFHGDAVKRF
jgi:hypothetical protein